jgi:hypothetical protein
MKYAVEGALCGMIYAQIFTAIGSGNPVILRLLPQQFGRLQCYYYSWEEFMKYDVQMISGGMIYIPSFINIGQALTIC